MKGVAIPGLSVHRPTDADGLLAFLQKGNANRTQHPTDANAESSRSHAVFQVRNRISNELQSSIQEANSRNPIPTAWSQIDLAIPKPLYYFFRCTSSSALAAQG